MAYELAYQRAATIPTLLKRARAAVRGALRRGGPAPALQGLSPGARALLRRLLATEAGALSAPSLTGSAIGLELRDVIGIEREAEGSFRLVVNGWAVEQLRRHPELIER